MSAERPPRRPGGAGRARDCMAVVHGLNCILQGDWLPDARRPEEDLWRRIHELLNGSDRCADIRFSAEVASVKELVALLQQAIESEQKVLHELVLHGDSFLIDKHVFMDLALDEMILPESPFNPLLAKAPSDLRPNAEAYLAQIEENGELFA